MKFWTDLLDLLAVLVLLIVLVIGHDDGWVFGELGG